MTLDTCWLDRQRPKRQRLVRLYIYYRYLLSFLILCCSLSFLSHFCLVRQLIDDFAKIPDSLSMQVEVVKELIQWADTEKRVYLKQNLETR